jgi:translin
VLETKHQAREITLRASRQTIQCAAASIRATQRGEYTRAEELAAEAADALARADEAVAGHPDVRHGGYLHDAKKEYAEARITLAFVRGDPLPAPGALGVEAPAYLNGLAEAASELRRHILDCLRVDRLERAELLLATMDEVYGLLVTVDFPDAVTGGLRRTTDALRAVIERTRGDLTNALVAARLRAAVEGADGAGGANST